MPKNILIFCAFLIGRAVLAPAVAADVTAQSDANLSTAGGEYTMIVEGYDWGPAVSRVVLSLNQEVAAANYQDYAVSVARQTQCVALPADQAAGERRVVHAYVSDAKGNATSEAKYVTLVLAVSPTHAPQLSYTVCSERWLPGQSLGRLFDDDYKCCDPPNVGYRSRS